MTAAITIDVLEDDAVTVVGTLSTVKSPTFLDDLSDVGAYEFEIAAGGADQAMLTDGRILRFNINGVPRWLALVEDRDPVAVDPGQRIAGRVVRCSGRGLLAITERVEIYPELGLGLIAPTQRYMNHASRDFTDDATWDAATELKAVTDTAGPWSVGGVPAPQGWPTELAAAYWIGAAGDDVPGVAPGKRYFTATFTIPVGEGGEHRFFMTGDDGFEVFVDDDRVWAETRAYLWGRTREDDLILDEGEHRIAVTLTNIPRPNPAANVTAFLFGVAAVEAGGQELGAVRLVSDGSWKVLADPATPPGMNAGKTLTVFADEGQTRGNLPGLVLDFDEDVDSAGTPWPVKIDVNFAVGSTSLMDVIRHLHDEGVCDVAMGTAGLVLHAYVRKGDPLAVDVAAGSNVHRLAHRQVPPGPNVGLLRTAEGRWVEYQESAAVAAYGRRETGLSLGSAPSDEAADRQAAAFFADSAYPVEAIHDLQLEVLVPFEDYTVGDVIPAPTVAGSAADFRVHGIRCAQDEAGQLVVTPELVKEEAAS